MPCMSAVCAVAQLGSLETSYLRSHLWLTTYDVLERTSASRPGTAADSWCSLLRHGRVRHSRHCPVTRAFECKPSPARLTGRFAFSRHVGGHASSGRGSRERRGCSTQIRVATIRVGADDAGVVLDEREVRRPARRWAPDHGRAMHTRPTAPAARPRRWEVRR
jgi:hypothetical protein